MWMCDTREWPSGCRGGCGIGWAQRIPSLCRERLHFKLASVAGPWPGVQRETADKPDADVSRSWTIEIPRVWTIAFGLLSSTNRQQIFSKPGEM